MNAYATQDFGIVPAPVTEWLVLLCDSSRTLAVSAALEDYGVWTPTWKRKRRMPRSAISRVLTEACIPGMLFVPTCQRFDLPHVARSKQRFMLNPDWTLTRIPERQMDGLRKVADKPLVKARDLPRIGSRVKFNETSPFYGWDGTVVACSQRLAHVAVEGFSQPIQSPPCMLVNV